MKAISSHKKDYVKKVICCGSVYRDKQFSYTTLDTSTAIFS